ncbi:MAG: SDR family oxidoreductase, partial [Actinobacteria bacterium]|nr:SDR family oxidoreductase [Actinomycetota bacterium]
CFDVSDPAAVGAFVDKTVATFGRLDVLMNNAGIASFGKVTELSDEDWRKVIAVDLDAVFYGSRAAMPHLARTGGVIVNTASISGLYGDYGLSAYNAAKGGVVNLTRAMAIDHARDGVRVNVACGGGLDQLEQDDWLVEPKRDGGDDVDGGGHGGQQVGDRRVGEAGGQLQPGAGGGGDDRRRREAVDGAARGGRGRSGRRARRRFPRSYGRDRGRIGGGGRAAGCAAAVLRPVARQGRRDVARPQRPDRRPRVLRRRRF